MGRVVRLLATFDMVFSMMHAVQEAWPAAVAATMSYCGYLGARTFRRDLTLVYLVYLTVFAAARLIVRSVTYVANSTEETELAQISAVSAVLVLNTVLQLVIAQFVWRFYTLLPTSVEAARFVQQVSEHRAAWLHGNALPV